jgi:predicted DNA-binding transcriptional regulator AlpA
MFDNNKAPKAGSSTRLHDTTNINDQYITIDELCARIKFSRQSIYNLIHRKALVLNIHYFKPTAGKLLFSWPSIQNWIEGRDTSATDAKTIAGPTDCPSDPTPRAQTTSGKGNRIII